MRKRKKYIAYLIIATLSLVGFLLFINTFEPIKIVDVFSVKLYPEIPFFVLLFVISSCLSAFAFANSRRGIIIGALFTAIALLQYFNVNNLLYVAILVVISILLEFLFWKKK